MVPGSALARALGALGGPVQSFARSRGGLALTGGAVRDAIRGKPVKDVDIAVEKGSVRAVGKAFADTTGGALVMLGQERLARVVLPGATADFTPLRAGTLEADLELRDFTVNALAVRLPWGQRNEVVDPTGGLADLRGHRLSACSARSLRDDPVRLWRAHRQACEMGLRIDAVTKRLIARDARLGSGCSAERLRDELVKLFSGGRAGAVLRDAAASGVLEATFPVFRPMRRVRAPGGGEIRVLDHTIEAVGHLDRSLRRLGSLYPRDGAEMASHLGEEPVAGRPRRALLRMACLLHDVAKPRTIKATPEGDVHFYEHEHMGARMAAEIMRERLRMSEREIEIAARIINLHLRPGYLAAAGGVSDKAAWRLIRDAGDELFELLLHAEADRQATHHGRVVTARGQRAAVQRVLAFRRQMRERVPARRILTGHDLIRELGVKPGPVIGELLRAVDEAVALGKAVTRESALAVARAVLPGLQAGAKGAARGHSRQD